jgi:hypothetical protein
VTTSEKFTKTWRFKNVGTCTWKTSYKFVFIGGDQMGAVDSIQLPSNVDPGQTIDISIDLTAPTLPGIYKGIWSFENTDGRKFGLGTSANGQIWVQVKVLSGPTPTPTVQSQPTQTSQATATTGPGASTPTAAPTTAVPLNTPSAEDFSYNMVSQACSAQWQSNKVQQPCPGPGNEAQGIRLVQSPTLEDGTTVNIPAIMMYPGNANVETQGTYPEYQVQPGDHFRAIASCEMNSVSCSALLRVSYQDSSNNITDLWAVGEFYDQKHTKIDIDISALAGQKVKFILGVTPLNANPENHVLWIAPGIYHETPPTATPTVTPTTAPTATATRTPVPTATPQPTPLPGLTPQPGVKSLEEKLQDFLGNIFKSIFGG